MPKAPRHWLEISALGFGALSLIIAFGAIGLAMLVGGWLVGSRFAEHDRMAWVAAWVVEAAAGAFAGMEIAKRAPNPVYVAISRSVPWQIVLAAVPQMLAILALGMTEVGPENPPARVAINALMFTAGFPAGGIGGVLWQRRRRESR
ncbi:MAG TPA: hypothetical protein VMV18_00335 [bacterium]|nr:hypothetical protein [bacterium]